MQTPKASRNNFSEVPLKISPRAVRQLKTNALESDSVSSSNRASRTPKDRSPKVTERRSPRSPASELQRKRPSRISELEFQVSQLQDELKKANDQLSLSESWKRQAEQEAEESKMQLLAISLKLKDSQKQLLELTASEEARAIELQKISADQDQAWQSKVEAIQKQHPVESATLIAAVSEIHWLKGQLEMLAQSEAAQTKNAGRAHAELHKLKENLTESISLVEDVQNQMKNCTESEAQAQELIGKTLLQLETAKKTVETLRSDSIKAVEAYDAAAQELDQSRARTDLLDGLISKLKAVLAGNNNCQDSAGNHEIKREIRADESIGKSMQLEEELTALKTEFSQVRTALEAAEIGCQEEQIRSALEIRNANELVEQVKAASSLREAQLESELSRAKADIDELKANLMDKETELQGISEENEGLHMKLEKSLTRHKEYELERELNKSYENIEKLKANLMDKETELQNISEENEILKFEIKKWEMDGRKTNPETLSEVEAARAAEREALVKLGTVTEEADKSNRRVVQVIEQLEAAQAANSVMEAELRRLKVQSDQWRKAAEAAASMLSAGNNGKLVERTGSLDNNSNPISGKISLPYSEDIEEDLLKKKNGNMLKKIGVLWKKPQK